MSTPSAKQVAQGRTSTFAVAEDEQGNLMVFSARNDRGLWVYRRDKDGVQVGAIELSPAIAAPGTGSQSLAISAVALLQNVDSFIPSQMIKLVCLVAFPGSSKFAISPAPFYPNQIPFTLPQPSLTLKSDVSVQLTDATVTELNQVIYAPPLSHTGLGDVRIRYNTNKVARIGNKDPQTLQWFLDVTLPQDLVTLIDVYRANISATQAGYHFLYQRSDFGTSLRFCMDGPGGVPGGTSTTISIPTDTYAIVTIPNAPAPANSATDLLIGSRGLYYYPASSLYFSNPPPPTPLTGLKLFPEPTANKYTPIKSLSVLPPPLPTGTFASKVLSVFALATDGRVAFVRLNYPSIVESAATATVVNMCDKGGAVEIHGFRPSNGGDAAKGGVSNGEVLVIKDRLGNLTVWEEDVSTGTWRPGEVLWS